MTTNSWTSHKDSNNNNDYGFNDDISLEVFSFDDVRNKYLGKIVNLGSQPIFEDVVEVKIDIDDDDEDDDEDDDHDDQQLDFSSFAGL